MGMKAHGLTKVEALKVNMLVALYMRIPIRSQPILGSSSLKCSVNMIFQESSSSANSRIQSWSPMHNTRCLAGLVNNISDKLFQNRRRNIKW
mmetsp:Transcript_20113/g.48360  ORF Transcript_20113/g.48360 Transcript_20113/m.48360 type:complete len:92 (+) Transcript_20113:33-308(+)